MYILLHSTELLKPETLVHVSLYLWYDEQPNMVQLYRATNSQQYIPGQ